MLAEYLRHTFWIISLFYLGHVMLMIQGTHEIRGVWKSTHALFRKHSNMLYPKAHDRMNKEREEYSRIEKGYLNCKTCSLHPMSSGRASAKGIDIPHCDDLQHFSG